jgi:hypothetical protein
MDAVTTWQVLAALDPTHRAEGRQPALGVLALPSGTLQAPLSELPLTRRSAAARRPSSKKNDATAKAYSVTIRAAKVGW